MSSRIIIAMVLFIGLTVAGMAWGSGLDTVFNFIDPAIALGRTFPS